MATLSASTLEGVRDLLADRGAQALMLGYITGDGQVCLLIDGTGRELDQIALALAAKAMGVSVDQVLQTVGETH